MREDELEVIEKWYQYQSTGDAKTVLKLIKYVRQLEKEKGELTRKGEGLCQSYGEALMQFHEIVPLAEAGRKSSDSLYQTEAFKKIRELATKAITKHSTEGAG